MTSIDNNSAAVASVDDFFDLPAIGNFFDANATEVAPVKSPVDLEAMIGSQEALIGAPAALDDSWGLTALGQPFVPTTAVADEPAAFVQHLNAGKATKSCASPTDITSSIALTPAAKKKLSRPKAVKATTAREPSAKAAAKATPPTAVALSDGTQDLEVSAAGSEQGGPLSVDEEDDDKKKADRMARNRASAAQSRKRKKQQVEELEEMIAKLQDEVQALKKQNSELRGECARATGLGGLAREELLLPGGNPPPSPPHLPEANSAACA